jgi:hypothetical protein
MTKKHFLFGLTLFLLLNTIGTAQFFSLETKRLRLIYYSKGHEYVVPHLARSFENALNFHEQMFNYHSKEKINVLLEDFGDFGNAGAISIPTNYIKVSIAPFSYVYEIRPANERMNWMMNHELVHIVASDKPTKSDNFYRSIFGGKVFPMHEDPLSIAYSYLTNPREYAPRWYHEGAAVFMETWMAGGLGRAIGPYDEMVFRTKVRDSSHIYQMIGLESEGTTIDFQVGANSYLYGTRFLSYLGYTYGPDKLINWISRDEDSDRYFSSQFQKVYQISIDEEWRNWIRWEKNWQNANLDSIREFPVTTGRRVTNIGLGSISRSYHIPDRNSLLTAIRYPGQLAHLAEIDLSSGEIEKITNLKGAALYFVTSLAFDHENNHVFYTTNNYGWRDLNLLNLNTGKSELLIKEFRGGSLTFCRQDSSLWGVRHFNGISTLVRIPYPYYEWDQVYSFPYGHDLYDIDISPSGNRITAALSQTNGKQNLIMMDVSELLAGQKSYDVLFDFEVSSPANFVFSEDGNFLYGSSYYSGVSNIYRYNFDIGEMEILSNAESGFFRPVPVSQDSLLAFEYTGEGFVPVMLAINTPEQVGAIEYLGTHIIKKYPELKSWALDSPKKINLDSIITFKGEYNTFSRINMNSVIPVIHGYKNYVAVGARMDFSDGLGLSSLDMSASISPHNHLPLEEKFHFAATLHHWNWKIFTTFNRADFYDLFGPTKTSRRGYSLGCEYLHTIIFDDPKKLDFVIFLEGWAGLETLPDFQNVVATSKELVTARFALDYEYIRKSLGAVDDEQGIKWQLVSHNDFVNKKFIFRIYNNLDLGLSLPINHSSIWLRTSVGHSFGDRDDPFANFFFGGFGNNWVDHLTEKRYRNDYSFPGAEINEFGGKNYLKLLMEWNLPPVRFRKLGFPALFCNWMRTAVFASAIRANIDGEPAEEPLPRYGFRRTLFNLGAQIDFRLVVFSNLSSTFSIGYARALEKDIKANDEFMVSLKIM